MMSSSLLRLFNTTGVGATGPASTLNDGWIASYSLNEASGATRIDSVGGNNLVESGGSGSVTSVAGINGNAAYFNASVTNRRLISSAFPSLDDGFTLLCWVNQDVGGANGILTLEGASQGLRLQGNDTELRETGQFFAGNNGVTGWTKGDIHRIVFIWDGVDAYLGRDGEALNTFTPVVTPDMSAPLLSLGIADGQAWGDLWIDQVDIWDRALTTDELTEHWNGGTGKFPPW